MKNYSYKITGLMLTMRYNTKNKRIIYRKLVSPTFIKLFYQTISGDFDKDNWNDLNIKEKQFLSKVLNDLDINNKEFNLALSNQLKDKYHRIELIEGSIKMGNNNKDLLNEYIEIIEDLKKYNINSTRLFSNLIKRVSKMIEED